MKDIFSKLFKDMLTVSVQAKVSSVDRKSNTCDVQLLDGGAEILDVQLRSDDGATKGQIIYPTVGSVVIVSPVANSNTHFFVSMFSQIDEILNEIDNTKMIVGKEGFTFEKGNESLKGLLTDIVDQMLMIYAPKDVPGITKLKIQINNLFK